MSGMVALGIIVFLVIVAGVVTYLCCYRRVTPSSQPFFQSRILSQRLSTPCKTHHSRRSMSVLYCNIFDLKNSAIEKATFPVWGYV